MNFILNLLAQSKCLDKPWGGNSFKKINAVLIIDYFQTLSEKTLCLSKLLIEYWFKHWNTWIRYVWKFKNKVLCMFKKNNQLNIHKFVFELLEKCYTILQILQNQLFYKFIRILKRMKRKRKYYYSFKQPFLNCNILY